MGAGCWGAVGGFWPLEIQPPTLELTASLTFPSLSRPICAVGTAPVTASDHRRQGHIHCGTRWAGSWCAERWRPAFPAQPRPGAHPRQPWCPPIPTLGSASGTLLLLSALPFVGSALAETAWSLPWLFQEPLPGVPVSSALSPPEQQEGSLETLRALR